MKKPKRCQGKINISLSVILKRVQTKSFISCCHILCNFDPFEQGVYQLIVAKKYTLLKSIRICNNHLYSFPLKYLYKESSCLHLQRWMDSSWYVATTWQIPEIPHHDTRWDGMAWKPKNVVNYIRIQWRINFLLASLKVPTYSKNLLWGVKEKL